MPKISIIIPVFNAEKYIRKCLDSISSQTFSDFEVICVDDQSADKSLDILTTYAQTDSRIKVYTQKHSRQGAARNLGLKEATGEYICFVDADDWLDSDALQLLYQKAVVSNADIVLTGTKLFDENEKYLERDWCNYEGWSDFKNGIPSKEFFKTMAPVCSRLHKTDFIKKHKLKFVENCFYEDNSWGVLINIFAEKIAFIPNVYCYRQHKDSTTGIKDYKVFDWVKDFKYFYGFIKKQKIKSAKIRNAKLWYLRNFQYYLGELQEKDKKVFYQKICSILKLLKLSEKDFTAEIENKDGLYKFLCYLKKKDFYNRKSSCFYLFNIPVYRSLSDKDKKTRDDYLLGFIPFYCYRKEIK